MVTKMFGCLLLQLLLLWTLLESWMPLNIISEQVVKETVKKTEQTAAVLGEMDELTIQKNREKMFAKMSGKKPVKT